MRWFPLFLSGLLAACGNAVGDGSGPGDQPQPSDEPVLESPQNGTPQGDEPPDDAPPSDAPPPDEPPAEPPSDDEIPGDDDGDGVVNTGAPGPAPADAGQACAEWTECGPHLDDPNSGFDCEGGTCACDASGRWSQACAELGGSWSSFECFCFTNTTTMMPAAAPETPEQAADDVQCWWSWRESYCDPDEWVDTSYYERWCDAYDCYDEYVEDGYYVDGQCYGRWIKRCTDGNEYWY